MISRTVVPAQAETQFLSGDKSWTPACAGVTVETLGAEE
jgi:hypothetical protein